MLQARAIVTSRHVVAPWVSGLVLLAVYGYLVSTTRPFTGGSDAVVAVGFAGVGALAVRTVVRRHRARADRDRPARPGALWAWLAVIGLAAGWELATYFAGFGGHRRAWPTLSSLADIAFRYQAAKAAAAAVWIALGLGLARR